MIALFQDGVVAFLGSTDEFQASADPEVKRLAMQTEDHPVEYADFEGTIPEGNYGAGRVIVWDQGSWIALEDPEEGMRKGKLLFELKGHKLGGVWTLFRTKKKDEPEGRQWLMMKKPDAYAQEGEPDWSEASVFSGLTLDELRDGSERAAHLRSDQLTHDIPIVMVTSRSTAKHREQAHAAGIDAFITKPYLEDDLAEQIRLLISPR